MSGTPRRLSAAALALAFLLRAQTGACQSEERIGARAAAVEGAKAFSEKRWADAIDYFKRAESLVHAPPHLLYMARAQVETGRLVEARENYLALIHEELKPDAPQVFRNAKDSAATEIKNVEPRIPYVTISLKGDAPPDLAITQDGARIPSALVGIPRPINPGVHKFEAMGKGVAGTAAIDLKESERQTVVIELSPSANAVAPPPAPADGAMAPGSAAAPAAPAPGAPPADAPGDKGSSGGNGLFIGSMVGFGVGAVGLVVGTVFMLKASSKSKDGDKLFSDNNCAAGCPDQQSQINDLDSQAKSARTLGLVGFVTGGLGVATGVTLLVLSGKKKSEAAYQDTTSLRIAIGPSSVLLGGRF